MALHQVAEIEILAKGAEKIAGTEEDRAGAARSHQRRFFPEMGVQARHDGFSSRPAETLFPGKPVHPTIPWAQDTAFQEPHGPTRAFLKLSFPVQFQIGWLSHNGLSFQAIFDSYIIK
jgi:hypothetical protein